LSVEHFKRLYVGLTGGFATGKSTVSALLHEKFAVVVIDVDKAGRAATDLLSVRTALRQAFGDRYFDAQGGLHRRKLGKLIFTDEQARQRLNEIVHPVMLAMVATAIHSVEQSTLVTPYVVLDAALLFELDLHKSTDFIITVTAPLEICVQRAVLRDGMSRVEALARLQAQWPMELKEAKADLVIHNDKDRTALEKSVSEAHDRLLAAAERKSEQFKKYESATLSTCR
jgi:dephospho-CoA kinase